MWQMESLRENTALKHAEALFVTSKITSNVVNISNEDVEFFVQLLDLSADSFPDRPSFLKPAVDSLFH